MILVPTVMAAVKIAGIKKVGIDPRFCFPFRIIISQQSDNEPGQSETGIKHANHLQVKTSFVRETQHEETHKIGKFLPEFPHNAPHWDLSDRMAEPTKATRSPQWRHPHPNRKKAEYQ